jgi:hypothetical protein
MVGPCLISAWGAPPPAHLPPPRPAAIKCFVQETPARCLHPTARCACWPPPAPCPSDHASKHLTVGTRMVCPLGTPMLLQQSIEPCSTGPTGQGVCIPACHPALGLLPQKSGRAEQQCRTPMSSVGEIKQKWGLAREFAHRPCALYHQRDVRFNDLSCQPVCSVARGSNNTLGGLGDNTGGLAISAHSTPQGLGRGSEDPAAPQPVRPHRAPSAPIQRLTAGPPCSVTPALEGGVQRKSGRALTASALFPGGAELVDSWNVFFIFLELPRPNWCRCCCCCHCCRGCCCRIAAAASLFPRRAAPGS